MVTTELDRLFNPHPGHYYHNITGSFKGQWTFEESLSKSIDLEYPLPPRPIENEDSKKEGETSPEESKSEDETTNSTITNSNSEANLDERVAVVYGDQEIEAPVDPIEDKQPHYLEDLETFRGPFQYNRSGTFSFSVKETKATEQVNWVKVKI